MKIDVAPVSAIACEAANVIAFTHSNCSKFVEQLDATIVALSSTSSYDNIIASSLILLDWVGYND